MENRSKKTTIPKTWWFKFKRQTLTLELTVSAGCNSDVMYAHQDVEMYVRAGYIAEHLVQSNNMCEGEETCTQTVFSNDSKGSMQEAAKEP